MKQRDLYNRVNDAWQRPRSELPKLEGQEAISAAKRLWRKATGKAWAGRFRLTSGNRYSKRERDEKRRLVWVINPDRGWSELVHDISHRAFRIVRKGESDHSSGHAWFEKELVEYVIAQGWLDGRLRRPAKVAPPRKETRIAALIERERKWAAKAQRADRALRKVRRSLAYYAKT